MENILNAQTRPAILLVWLILLWLIENNIPLAKSNRRTVIPNMLLTILVIAIYSLFGLLVIAVSNWTARNHFGVFNWIGVNSWIKLIAGIMLLDFWSAYVSHVVMHKIGWLWKAHSVHHLDTMVDVTTTLRQHPIESIVRNVFLISAMFILGLPALLVVAYQTLSTFIAQIEHANIAINPKLDKLLQLVFTTPNYHKVHHSKFQQETDSNYGNIFSIWDRMFSTFRKRIRYDNIEYGLDHTGTEKDISFFRLLKLPFKKNKSNTVS